MSTGDSDDDAIAMAALTTLETTTVLQVKQWDNNVLLDVQQLYVALVWIVVS